MKSLFGVDIPQGTQWLIALAVILVLMAVMWFLLRNFASGKLRLRGQAAARNRQPRLGVVDIFDLDRQRQLVLVRRDNVEHLILIGGQSDVVIESNIVRGSIRAPAPQSQAENLELTGSQVERAMTFALAEPSLRENALPPAPTHASQPFSDTRLPEAKPLTPAAASAPVKDTGTSSAIQAGAMASAARTPPEPVRQAANGAMQPKADPKHTTSTAMPAPAMPPSAMPAPLPPALALPALADPSQKPLASDLDDMTRQLEEALKRPFAAVRPSGAATADRSDVPAPVPAPVPATAKPAAALQKPDQGTTPPAPPAKAAGQPGMTPAMPAVAALAAAAKVAPMPGSHADVPPAKPEARPETRQEARPEPKSEERQYPSPKPSPEPSPEPMPQALAGKPAPASVTPETRPSAADADFDLEMALAQALEMPVAAHVAAKAAPQAMAPMPPRPSSPPQRTQDKPDVPARAATSPPPSSPALAATQHREPASKPLSSPVPTSLTSSAPPSTAASSTAPPSAALAPPATNATARPVPVAADTQENASVVQAITPAAFAPVAFTVVPAEASSPAMPTAPDAADPFSLDSIEAEFNRLLGRNSDSTPKG